ncbi:MAG: hypothetical protein LBT94_01860 [Prevotellaceae bacterium]|jgi:hypothetical protein|nr:hypothetical protein [Prevotellaceae bacterium]
MKKIFYLTMAAALVCGCAEDEEGEATGSIYGVISNKNSGEPLSAASIELGIGSNLGGTPTKKVTLKQTVSGNDGQYEFKDIEPDLSAHGSFAVHYIEVSKAGYESEILKVEVHAGQVANGDVLLKPSIAITTNGVSDITGTSAKLSASYQCLAPFPMSVGFYYSASSHSVQTGAKVNATTWNHSAGAAGVTDVGGFSETISGLATNTTYYVQAYTTSTKGTSYGEVVSFTTLNQ